MFVLMMANDLIVKIMKIMTIYSPYHEAISRLEDMQRTWDVWKAHGADKDGYCHLQQEDANYVEDSIILRL